jgi:DNA helicase-2/ATP-dependent DNA helicase PcrA
MLAAATDIIETDELKPKARKALFDVVTDFRPLAVAAREHAPYRTCRTDPRRERLHGHVAERQIGRSAGPVGKPEGTHPLDGSLREPARLPRTRLAGHGRRDQREPRRRFDHDAAFGQGLEFETVFLPGWEEGLFPHQRALDEGGRSGLEEERRLAYVGITRAKRRCHIWFVSNRRIHGLWQSTLPSRFLEELPPAHVEVAEAETSYGGYGRNPYGQSRFDKQEPFQNSYSTPGWKRAQANKTDATRDNWGNRSGHAVERIGYGESGPRAKTIDGELVAKSTATEPSRFSVGDRVFHIKFGNGNISSIEGNKLTIDFDRAGQKRVLDGFVEKA